MDAPTLAGDHYSREDLGTLFVAFTYLCVYAYAIAYLERRQIFFHLFLGDEIDYRVHSYDFMLVNLV